MMSTDDPNHGHIDHMRQLSWQDRTPPPKDPVRTADLEGKRHYNKSTGFTLFHQSTMTTGRYRSWLMERVPARLLLYLADYRQNRENPKFRDICDYVERHRDEIEARYNVEGKEIDFYEDFREKDTPAAQSKAALRHRNPQ
jgi:hypothetical protein